MVRRGPSCANLQLTFLEVRTVRVLTSNVATTRRPVLVAISAMLLVLVAAGPVLADHEQGHTGIVGFHELRDGKTGGAVCRYKQLVPSPSGYTYEAKLKRIDVRAPRVRASSGSQEVGWRFIVERRGYSGTWSPWVVTYRSPVQRDTTNTTTDASFTSMGVAVAVPTTSADDSPAYVYRVLVRMFWYGADGRTRGSALHLTERYRTVLNYASGRDPVVYTERYPCDAWQAFIAN
jgi:hypothetical protein